ncbi:PREDICTED: protein Mdm4 [Gavialis gangeticus]|uniref:protein Mdm4 n=1 Tax=Gavialis gangeticus TaxID=94835 RepID=UPI00092F7469|nr:PREDICTED: protein Mdm4 [Gavialis gangeticus]
MSSTSTQYPAFENASRIAHGQPQQVRPRLPFLRILQAAGAQGETFTLKEVMHYLGQYIMVRELYDKQEQHIVHCGGDPLRELMGLDSFSVTNPRPVYDMLRRNLLSATVTDAAQTLVHAKDQSIDNASRDQPKSSTEGVSDVGRTEGESNAPALSTSEHKSGNCEEKDLLESNLKSRSPKPDLALEEWDVAGLPWWFIGNLKNNYGARSSGSTDIQNNQDIDTAIVSDTTDDLWFLNESAPDQLNVIAEAETADCEEGKESDKQETEATYFNDSEDSQCLDDDVDTEIPSEECWQCSKCKKFNSPVKRYCYRCWALRKNWYSDCPKLVHSLSMSNIDAMQDKNDDKGIDVPDCRRTVSAPVGQAKHPFLVEGKSHMDPCSSIKSMDLAEDCSSQETLVNFGKHEEKEKESFDNIKQLLDPCLVCQKRPRNGNIVHGKSAHLVACFRCAKMLRKGRSPCPVCKKEIHGVIKVFMA